MKREACQKQPSCLTLLAYSRVDQEDLLNVHSCIIFPVSQSVVGNVRQCNHHATDKSLMDVCHVISPCWEERLRDGTVMEVICASRNQIHVQAIVIREG